MFTLTVTATDDFQFNYQVSVPDGKDVRAHDIRLVLELAVAELARMGAQRLPTESEAAANKAAHEEALATLAEWEPTLDGVSVLSGVASRTYVKRGHTEPVVAVCAPDGSPTMETVSTLRAWVPTEG